MVEPNAPRSNDLASSTPDVGAERAMSQALVTVTKLQTAASAHASAMIPGEWAPRIQERPAQMAKNSSTTDAA